MLSEVGSYSNVETLFIILAVVAFGLALWRASKSDVKGTLLAGGVGLVIVLFAI